MPGGDSPMAREFAKAFYKSRAWRDCRDAYAASKAFLCEECLKKGMYVPGKIVHHRVHLSPENISDPNVTLNWKNLKLVCQDCHAREHVTLKRYAWDSDGNLVPPLSQLDS